MIEKTESATPNPTRRDMIESLQEHARAVLSPLVPDGSKCALVDFPNHNNSGDNAIWAGEMEYLKSYGIDPVYTCDIATYSARQLAKSLGNGTILIHGGGNLGDIWPHHQRFRERVIHDFPDKRIVQLPQTVDFRDEAEAERAGLTMRSHQGLTVLVRDGQSHRTATDVLGLRSVVCPDMAFFIGPRQRSAPPEVDVTWLSRRDRESLGAHTPQFDDATIEVVDWIVGSGTRTGEWLATAAKTRFRSLVGRVASRSPDRGPLGFIRAVPSRFFNRLAQQRLERGLSRLSRGRVVVTDRLHGHILCILLGIPHVLLDNAYGKISRFHRDFTEGYPSAVVASDPVEALRRAREFLERAS